MKLYNYIALLAFLGCLLMAGCYKDNGYYDYGQKSNYFIDTLSVSRSAVIKQNETITITPQLVNSADASGLKYKWRLLEVAYTPNPGTGGYIDKEVGTQKDLSYKVIDNPGEYQLVLYTSDEKNGGITQMIKVKLQITSYASPGWMVLHSDASGSDVSILVNKKMNSLLPENTDYVQQNVFSETNGKKIEGEGADLRYMINHWVNVFTKNNVGGYRASGNDMRILNDYKGMFVEPINPAEVEFQAYGTWSYNETLLNKGGVYFSSQPNTYDYFKYGVRCFGEDYYAAPHLATIFNYSYYGVFYDAKNRRFLFLDYSRTVKQFKPDVAGAAFSMRNTGMDMIYAEHGFSNNWFCVMTDPANPTTRELFGCAFNVADDGKRGVSRVDLTSAPEIQTASRFAFGNRGNVMYYSTDKKIYQSNYAGNLSSDVRMDVSTLYPGYEITAMKVFKQNLHPSDGKILYVGIYNPATKAGSLLQIDINEVSGVFGTIKEYTGFGKITGMNYKVK